MGCTYQMVGATDIGQIREINEDSLCIMPAINLAVIADGMGGHRAGDVASRMAVTTLCDYFQEQILVRDEIGGQITPEIMSEGFSMANSQVFANAHQVPSYEGMGTTLLAGAFLPYEIHVGHIGDSRIYRFSRGELTVLTTDHTLATELGAGSPDWELPAYSHHVLRKALGIESSCSPDFLTLRPRKNEIYLLCSDGLSGVVSEHDIATILALRSDRPEHCVETLIDACIENGAPDNVSIILVFARAETD